MSIKHDSQGFLIGDPIDIGRALTVWDDIHEDVKAIRRVLTDGGSALPRTIPATPRAQLASQVPALLRKAATPQTSGNNARRGAQSGIAAVSVSGQATQRTTVRPAARDSRGRFVAGGSRRRPNDGTGDVGTLRSLADRIVGAAKESGAGIEEADPAVKAFNEVARPLARGYQMLTGGDSQKKQEGWLRRIYTSLTSFRKEESTFNKVANKTLKNIEEKNPTDGRTGLFDFPRIQIPKIPFVGNAVSSVAGLLGGVGKSALRLGKNAFRRLPLLGALLSVGGAASDIYDSENDDTLTRREKDQHDGKAVGGAAGSVGGMFAGAKLGAMVGALGGPIGAAIGGVVGGAAGMFFGDQAGQILGEKVGGWVNDLRDADIPGKIVGAWEATTKFLQDGWNSATDVLKRGWGDAKSAADSAKKWVADKASATNDFIKDKSGVDVRASTAAVKDKAVELGGKAVDVAKTGAVVLKDNAVEAGSNAIDWAAKNTTVGKGVVAAYQNTKTIRGKVDERWNDAKQYLLDASDKAGVDAGTVAKIANFESGFDADAAPIRKDGTHISSAHGYGQFIDGTWTDMLNKYGAKYGVEGAGKLTKEQAAKYRDDKTVQAGMLAEFTRENIEKGHKFGGADDDANVYAFHNLGDKDAKNLLTGMQQNPSITVRQALLQGATTDKERARVEAVISGNKSLYGDGNVTATDAYIRMGQALRRGDVFATDARQAQGVAIPSAPMMAKTTTPAIVASTNMPPISVAPSVPTLAETQPITVPMGSRDSGKPVVVSVASPDVGQDVRERGIAHVVTGGLANV